MYLDLVVVEHFTDKISFNTRAWTHTHTHTYIQTYLKQMEKTFQTSRARDLKKSLGEKTGPLGANNNTYMWYYKTTSRGRFE